MLLSSSLLFLFCLSVSSVFFCNKRTEVKNMVDGVSVEVWHLYLQQLWNWFVGNEVCIKISSCMWVLYITLYNKVSLLSFVWLQPSMQLFLFYVNCILYCIVFMKFNYKMKYLEDGIDPRNIMQSQYLVIAFSHFQNCYFKWNCKTSSYLIV